MKAVYFETHGGPEVLRYGDVPDPRPGPGEVLLRVKAAAVNYNDLWARNGMNEFRVPLPHISGTDTVGIVAELGEGVTTARVGDEVFVHPVLSCGTCAFCKRNESYYCRQCKVWGFQTGPLAGGFAEYCVVPAVNLVNKPPSLSWEEATTLPASLGTAWRMLGHRATVRPGDLVLVWGAGSGLGAWGVQVAKMFGGRPIAIARSDDKLEYARELGAEFTINRTTQDVEREVARIGFRTRGKGGLGVDVVFEHVGRATWPISLRVLRNGGSLVTCGATTGYDAAMDLRYLWMKQLTLLGSHLGDVGDWKPALEQVVAGKLRPLRQQVYELRDLSRALDCMASGDVLGKLVIVP